MRNILRYKDFYASICYEDETSTFLGKIEGIEDLMSFEAKTIEGLKKEFRDTVEEYLDECNKLGKNPYKQYKGSFNIRIEPDLHQKAVLLSKAFNMSLNQFVEKAIKEKVENCEK